MNTPFSYCYSIRLMCDSVSAGPHLLATNDQGETDIAIPWNDENIANVLEHASNTAVALRASTQVHFQCT
jgi:hypothetical protein